MATEEHQAAQAVEGSEERLNMELTQVYLRSILEYDSTGGVFRWKEDRRRGIKGRIAGTLRDKGAIRILIDGKGYYAHRLAWLYMYGQWPKDQIDHKDLNRANNAISNLREASNGQNQANSRKYKNNKSGYKGVHYKKKIRRWIAQIKYNGSNRYIGCFCSPEEAHLAYTEAAKQFHGEFARGA